MIEAIDVTRDRVRTAYDRRSGIYDRTVAPVEWPAHLEAIALLDPKPGERILDVAVGPGRSTAEIAVRVGPGTSVEGVDLSPGMLGLAAERARSLGLSNVVLREAEAARLPFEDGAFDALYNAYMLDLVPSREMAGILREFHRVLKPGGRLVLLNMSKAGDQGSSLRERLYRFLPRGLVLYVIGGCRPVFMEGGLRKAGFEAVTRTFLPKPMPSEIVAGTRPR